MGLRLAALAMVTLSIAACHQAHHGQRAAAAIVGAWVVRIPDAPFPLHMFVFHSDGTVVQSNPDAGDPNTSDSNLMGVWRAAGDEYLGRLAEITADRASHQFATRVEIEFRLKVSGDRFDGTASATVFDASGRQVKAPEQVSMQGERVQP
jgi:hypothetical protein